MGYRKHGTNTTRVRTNYSSGRATEALVKGEGRGDEENKIKFTHGTVSLSTVQNLFTHQVPSSLIFRYDKDVGHESRTMHTIRTVSLYVSLPLLFFPKYVRFFY